MARREAGPTGPGDGAAGLLTRGRVDCSADRELTQESRPSDSAERQR